MHHETAHRFFYSLPEQNFFIGLELLTAVAAAAAGTANNTMILLHMLSSNFTSQKGVELEKSRAWRRGEFAWK